MKKAFAKQERGLCFSTLNVLPVADSKSAYVELTCSESASQKKSYVQTDNTTEIPANQSLS